MPFDLSSSLLFDEDAVFVIKKKIFKIKIYRFVKYDDVEFSCKYKQSGFVQILLVLVIVQLKLGNIIRTRS